MSNLMDRFVEHYLSADWQGSHSDLNSLPDWEMGRRSSGRKCTACHRPCKGHPGQTGAKCVVAAAAERLGVAPESMHDLREFPMLPPPANQWEQPCSSNAPGSPHHGSCSGETEELEGSAPLGTPWPSHDWTDYLQRDEPQACRDSPPRVHSASGSTSVSATATVSVSCASPSVFVTQSVSQPISSAPVNVPMAAPPSHVHFEHPHRAQYMALPTVAPLVSQYAPLPVASTFVPATVPICTGPAAPSIVPATAPVHVHHGVYSAPYVHGAIGLGGHSIAPQLIGHANPTVVYSTPWHGTQAPCVQATPSVSRPSAPNPGSQGCTDCACHRGQATTNPPVVGSVAQAPGYERPLSASYVWPSTSVFPAGSSGAHVNTNSIHPSIQNAQRPQFPCADSRHGQLDTGLEFLDHKTVESAVNGEFVNLEEFLCVNNADVDELRSVIDEMGNLQVKSVKSRKGISSVLKWLEAWVNYEMIMCKKYGYPIYYEMARYRAFIINISQKFKFSHVFSYDVKHRQRLANSRSCLYSAVDHDLYITIFDAGAVKNVARCAKCSSLEHSTSQCERPSGGGRGSGFRARGQGRPRRGGGQQD